MPADQQRRFTIRPLTVVLVLIALACFGVAVYYAVTPAESLPGFFPGHQAGLHHHHTKHALAAAAVGLLVLIGAWFTTAPARAKGESTPASGGSEDEARTP